MSTPLIAIIDWAASPLDDYRLFFRFEVVIKSEGAVVGTLSKRMRSGSGGEHRARRAGPSAEADREGE